MYETRIIIPSRKGKGLGNIAVEAQKSSSKDKCIAYAIDAAIVIVILVFAFIAVEPLLTGGDPLTQFDGIASELGSSIRLYVADNRMQPDYKLTQIGGAPLDPWGNPLIYDSFWERIISTGPDGKLHISVPGVPVPANGEVGDDLFFYCTNYGSFWYSIKGEVNDEIGTMFADGRGNQLIPLAVESKRDVRYPDVSPDGQSIAFATLSAGGEWQITLAAANGTDVVYVPTIGDSRWPSWNSSGSSIIYESKRAGEDGTIEYSVFRFDCTAEKETRILSGRGNFRGPVFHPDYDDLIAYIYVKRGHRFPRICIYTPETADMRDYSTSIPVPQKSPSWFSGGREMAYIARSDGRLQAFSMTVSSRTPVPIEGISGDPQLISCAPAGRRVAVVTKNGDTYKIVVIDLNSGSKTTVYETKDKFYSLKWGN